MYIEISMQISSRQHFKNFPKFNFIIVETFQQHYNYFSEGGLD